MWLFICKKIINKEKKDTYNFNFKQVNRVEVEGEEERKKQ